MTTQTILDVGPDQQFTTIGAAIVAANQLGGNADIRVAAGTYTNDGGYLLDITNNVTIEGVGGMVAIVDPNFNAGGKAAIVAGGENIVLKNLDISGMTDPNGDDYGAAVYYDQGTLTLDNVHLHDNQAGILGEPDPTGSITIENSEIDHNGTSAGTGDNIAVGGIAQFILTDSYIHDADAGDEVKTRAENNIITNNRILDNNGTASLAVDLPNGGDATITGNVIEQGSSALNSVINAYGEAGDLHAGTAVTFSGNEIVNDYPDGTGALWQNDGATITGSANTAWDLSDLGTGVSPASVTALSTRPSLDLSSGTTTPTATILHPTITTITGIPYTGVRLAGTSAANSTVTVTDTVAGTAKILGTATTSATGAWSFFSASGLGHIDLSTVHDYSVGAQDAAGDLGAMPGALFLADTGNDGIAGTPGTPDVFAIMSFLGTDLIESFQTATQAGDVHDVINFSGRGLTSFAQVQPLITGTASAVITMTSGKTITLIGVPPDALTAADFRFS